ncbi:hypothetical protein SAMN05443270_3471 [Lacrimispora sphenoides]|uniref:hypothetical protein n=1 Tax=Lacrimispora sphenoides TaxID=29370 RepID=UPI0008ADA4F9|nr:hypothetical protein [Lacrimispora sphenoides]SEU22329.1 hypothetical protein SAMN05443270_3471 [Lacrimispora sphenoides]
MNALLSKYKCEGQLSFDFIRDKQPKQLPGEYINSARLGQELSFDEITHRVGNLIAIDCSTESRTWYKVVKIEEIYAYKDGTRRLIYYDGKRQRGLVDEAYFNKARRNPLRAWRLN